MSTWQILIVAVIGLYAVGRYEERVVGLVQAAFDLIIALARTLVVAVVAARRFLTHHTVSCFRKAVPLSPEQVERGVWPGWPLVGAFIFLAYAVFFTVADLWLVWLTLAALGFANGNDMALPVAVDQLMAVSLVVAASFWGVVLLDAQLMSHLGPWGAQGVRGRQKAKWFSVAMIALTLGIAGGLGLWRAAQMDSLAPLVAAAAPSSPVITYAGADSVVEPVLLPPSPVLESTPDPLVDERLERLVPLLVSVGLPVLITLSAALSGWGATTSVGLLVGLALGVGSVLLGLVQVLFALIITGLRRLCAVVEHGLRLTGRLVRGIWNWFAEYDTLEGGRPIKPMPLEPSDAIWRLQEAGQARIEAVSSAHRRQVYDQHFQPKKEMGDDEDQQPTDRGGAPLVEPVAGAAPSPNGAS